MGPARALAYLRVFAVVNLASLLWLLIGSHGGIDRNGFLVGTDFLSFWTTGRMLHGHHDPYDLAAHIAAQRAFFAPPDGFTAFFYPPVFLPLCWLLGWPGYFAALGGWLAITGSICFAALQAWWRRAGLGRHAALAALAFPPVVIVCTHGQSAFLVAGLLALGLILVPERKAIAGILLGLATIKPQFGLLVPIALLASREGQVIGFAVLGALALCALTTLAFGAMVWPHWLTLSDEARTVLDAGAVGYAKMASPFAAMRLLGASLGLAYGIQAIVSLAVAGAVGWTAWRGGYTQGLAALVLAGAPLATPFVFDYDLVLLGFPLVWLVGQGLARGWADWEKPGVAMAFAVPAFARGLAMHLPVPLLAPVLMGLFALVWRRALSQIPRSQMQGT
ncbi:DUF2029 domain-containing protein [Novosphingobium sp. 1949]|uniref:DUF2029 domain-containing protein n=1 Tax=Novosphingobium organovorum TaxID=2930092 RepID=A0ABT0BAH4_9SPHN|nr:glycosyltransferase family 87 protein [Novosphingobium organovorum]MCJ2181875.1 DUF2029 domain-containing protein [Novosphingobium organovorum]